MTKTIPLNKVTLATIKRRARLISNKLQNDESLSEEDKNFLTLYLKIPEHTDENNMKIKIEEFFIRLENIQKERK